MKMRRSFTPKFLRRKKKSSPLKDEDADLNKVDQALATSDELNMSKQNASGLNIVNKSQNIVAPATSTGTFHSESVHSGDSKRHEELSLTWVPVIKDNQETPPVTPSTVAADDTPETTQSSTSSCNSNNNSNNSDGGNSSKDVILIFKPESDKVKNDDNILSFEPNLQATLENDLHCTEEVQKTEQILSFNENSARFCEDDIFEDLEDDHDTDKATPEKTGDVPIAMNVSTTKESFSASLQSVLPEARTETGNATSTEEQLLQQSESWIKPRALADKFHGEADGEGSTQCTEQRTNVQDKIDSSSESQSTHREKAIAFGEDVFRALKKSKQGVTSIIGNWSTPSEGDNSVLQKTKALASKLVESKEEAQNEPNEEKKADTDSMSNGDVLDDPRKLSVSEISIENEQWGNCEANLKNHRYQDRKIDTDEENPMEKNENHGKTTATSSEEERKERIKATIHGIQNIVSKAGAGLQKASVHVGRTLTCTTHADEVLLCSNMKETAFLASNADESISWDLKLGLNRSWLSFNDVDHNCADNISKLTNPSELAREFSLDSTVISAQPSEF